MNDYSPTTPRTIPANDITDNIINVKISTTDTYSPTFETVPDSPETNDRYQEYFSTNFDNTLSANPIRLGDIVDAINNIQSSMKTYNLMSTNTTTQSMGVSSTLFRVPTGTTAKITKRSPRLRLKGPIIGNITVRAEFTRMSKSNKAVRNVHDEENLILEGPEFIEDRFTKTYDDYPKFTRNITSNKSSKKKSIPELIHDQIRELPYHPYTTPRTGMYRGHKTYPDYFNDLILWHNDILNMDSIANSTWDNVLHNIFDQMTTPNINLMQQELNEMKDFLDVVKSKKLMKKIKLKEEQKKKYMVTVKIPTYTEEKSGQSGDEDSLFIEREKKLPVRFLKAVDIINDINQLYMKSFKKTPKKKAKEEVWKLRKYLRFLLT